MKINDIDDFMLADDRIFGAGQTKGGNFFNSGDIQNSDYNLISGTGNKKRKKKQVIKKKKNLFKGDN